jgi:Protein of unknown function (DUF4058)
VPSPFPGMDPYIESWIFPSFHAGLITAIYDRLNPHLPKRFIASMELFVWRVDNTERLLVGAPEIYVADREPAPTGGGVVTIAAPVNTILPGITRKQRYIKIVDSEERRIVTVIEVLSPSNKTGGEDGQAYRLKREEYMANGISLVEIDLLRAGHRPPLGDPAPAISDYYVLVHRGWERNRMGIWPISLREPLPQVPVPLDADIPDQLLDLKPCFEHVYEAGRYAEQLDYTKPPKPPLREPDATWARELLANRITPT